MFARVEIPVWLLGLILLFAAVTFATHFLNPTVGWFFRKRAERVVARLNTRLQVPIQPFKLLRRADMIQRLIYDPAVIDAVSARARELGVREDVAFAEAKRYAREIVPGFSASAYFGFAIRAARWLSTSLYSVRRIETETELLADLDPEAVVVFVMNHRSNMDYVLVTYLVAERSALSYAVGEWARVWPLSALFRAMGAYFIRRKSRNALYRRVLARYVQLATAAGVTQAIFPEGGLSVTGAVGQAKLGLLSYLLDGNRDGTRPLVFVPVALNYDRVMEDRILIEAARTGERRFRGSWRSSVPFVLRWVWRRITGRIRRFGTAAVSYGTPLHVGPDDRDPDAVGAELMRRLRRAVPVLPIPLACLVLTRAGGVMSEAEFHRETRELTARLVACGARLALDVSKGDLPALDMLRLRNMVRDDPAGVRVVESKVSLVAYYAASIAHHLENAPEDGAALPHSRPDET
ncbi:1-acyl-sn-glycerol-3-phosphate acyltransferase [Oceaniglobus indicus]|uniref:1-acyl-sn-glycerol-3-phosphate acyltransferase n=1 Tax=Oceaniglobus indicus TaxID=2047749 RepID=UPI000C17CAF9|nr:1-acyl-sn-glycerol-3-phosphate acyltransferase [Oceaniglobus indicus]